MKSRKFLWAGVLVLVVMLFASYLVPNFYLRKYGTSIGDNNKSTYSGSNYNYNRGWRNGYGMMGSYRGRGMMGGYGRYGGMTGGGFRIN